jgi:hypothetical protein
MTTSSLEQLKSSLTADRFVDPVIRFLETFFSTFPLYTWDADETKTGIIVHDFEAFNLEKVDATPRIATELVSVDWNNVTVDNMQHLDLATTAKTRTDLVQGLVTAFCISKNQNEAKTIAAIVLKAIRMFKDELRKEGGFFSVDSVGYTRVQRVRSSSRPEIRSVPVTIRLSLKETYTQASDEAQYEAAGG